MAEEIKKEETANENKAEAKTEEKAAKKPRKNAEVEKLKAELEALNDKFLRTAAEFDNFKKRTERESSLSAIRMV